MKTRTNKFRGKRVWLVLKTTFKELLKGIYYLIVGVIYIILKIYIEFEKAFLKVWKQMPRWCLRIIIWTMMFNIWALNDKAPEIIEKIKTKIETKEVLTIKEVMIEPKKCEYGLYECAVYQKALEYGLTDEQGKIAIAISQWETGHYKSDLFKNKNNIGGLYNSSAKTFYSYSNVEEGIDAYIRNLKNGYFDKGLNTIELIQKKYCPEGAENDPNGLNKNWLNGVNSLYKNL